MTSHPQPALNPYSDPSLTVRAGARLPAEDWARDVAAAFLLLLSLALPWTYGGSFSYDQFSIAGGRVDVLLITILVAFGASLTFLMRGGVLGSLSVRALFLIRLAVAAPYVILVVVYMVLDGAGVVNGLGMAVGAGLAGAALIAQPRRSEIERDPSSAPTLAVAWRYALIALIGVIAFTAAIALIFAAISLSQFGTGGNAVIGLLLVFSLLVNTAISVSLFVFVVRGFEPARIIAGVISASILPLIFISALAGNTIVLPIESLRTLGYSAIWVAFAGGVLWAPSLALVTRAIEPLQKWFHVAKNALIVVIAVSALFLIQLLLGIASSQGAGWGVTIPMIVLAAASIVVAVLARTRLLSDPASSRPVVIGLASALLVAGIIEFVMAIVVVATGQYAVVIPAVLAGIGMITPAALVIVALTAPAEVRAYFQQFAPAQPANSAPVTTQAGYGAASQYAHPAANPHATPSEVAAWAADPQAWVHLAGNPATYPDMLVWLAEVGDERVQQVLRARRA